MAGERVKFVVWAPNFASGEAAYAGTEAGAWDRARDLKAFRGLDRESAPACGWRCSCIVVEDEGE